METTTPVALPSPRQHLEQLLPLAPVLDTATLGTGLGDGAARLSVARLLAGVRVVGVRVAG